MRKTFSRWRWAATLAGLCMVIGSAGAVRAADIYPNKSILVIVPLEAGSAADVATRVILGKVGQNMNQSFVIQNQPGASGLLGAELLSRATPDGYTLGGVTDSVLNYAANLASKLSFDPVESFTPISQMANISWVLVANKDFPAKTLPDLIAMAKKQPDSIDFASAGVGSPHHIAMELFAGSNGISLHHIPYKGASQATVNVASGQVPMMFSAVSVVQPFLKDGRLHALAQPDRQRSSLLPNVPTFAEAGAAPFLFSTWLGLYGPKGLPQPIVDRLNAEIAKALTDPTVRARLIQLGLDPMASTPTQLGTLTRDGYARVHKAIQDAGIKAGQ